MTATIQTISETIHSDGGYAAQFEINGFGYSVSYANDEITVTPWHSSQYRLPRKIRETRKFYAKKIENMVREKLRSMPEHRAAHLALYEIA